MKMLLRILSFIFMLGKAMAQQPGTPPAEEEKLEWITEVKEGELEEDDSRLQTMEWLAAHPLALNSVTASELEQLEWLSEEQMESFISYRKLAGALVSVYELQAIPGWDIPLIRKILPYIRIDQDNARPLNSVAFWRGGSSSVLIRYARKGALPLSSWQKKSDSSFLGNDDRLMLRYKYKNGNWLQYGFTAEKDAGEPLTGPSASFPADFFSFHFFVRDRKHLKALALGDFSVNWGQGLLQWQGLSTGAGAAVLSVNKQGPALKPYNSTGEFNFYRGAAIDWQKGRWEAMCFYSFRKLTANLEYAEPSDGSLIARSLISGGYHRTTTEIERKNRLGLLAWGSRLKRIFLNGTIAFNTVHYSFSYPLIKEPLPYNYFGFKGKRMAGYSIDYGFSFFNIHWLGEMALDQNGNRALLAGALMSPDSRFDLALLYRNYSRGYQLLFSNGFGSGSQTSNESGLYAGLSFHPDQRWTFDAGFDSYQSPWLRYRVDAPSQGSTVLLQSSYQPSKNSLLSVRYRRRLKPLNNNAGRNAFWPVEAQALSNGRLEYKQESGKNLSWRSRIEYMRLRHLGEGPGEDGFLWFTELTWKASAGFRSAFRLQYYETGGYDSRLYAYESDVLYSYSIPAFSGKGIRTYLHVQKRIRSRLPNSRLQCRIWWRNGLTIPLPGRSEVVAGPASLDTRLQVMLEW